MNIAVLGGGVEGKAVREYFEAKGDHVQIFDNFTDENIPSFHLEDYDKVFRSPSVHPQFELKDTDKGLSKTWTTMTRFFFENCKAPIIGVTGTKGKGTTCSIITSILKEIIKTSTWQSRDIHTFESPENSGKISNISLVGNIGNPSILELDKITPDDIVVYEMSSFQLWDLDKSPKVAIVLRIEPDHLDRHKNFEDYVNAKSNIVLHQSSDDYCIFYQKNPVSVSVSLKSPAHKFAYPITTENYSSDTVTTINKVLDNLQIPGEHNRENAEAAILTVSAFLHLSLDDLSRNSVLLSAVSDGLKNFKALPHRIQFVRNLNNVDYYDDNYASAFPALDVAVEAFKNRPTVLICGGKDRHLDLTKTKNRIFRDAKNLIKVILIGETKYMLAENEDASKYEIADSLKDAVLKAKKIAEGYAGSVVLMSPGAASFDMFKNFEDRGQKYQAEIKELK